MFLALKQLCCGLIIIALVGFDVESISITPDGVIIRSLEHGIAMYMDAVDLHATPYALLGLGGYEANETAFLKSVFNDGDLFLDIGANLGWFSIPMTGLFTLFYRGLLELSKSFLDPFGNRRVSFTGLSADINIDCLIGEVNVGSLVWPQGAKLFPF